MSILGIIPSRFASTRFPGKPLVKINGIPMIQRVYEQAIKSVNLDRVIVATDDPRIYDLVKAFGGEVEMTRSEHQNGTERCAEVAERHENYDFIINIQGDEPFVHPEQIDEVATLLNQQTTLATLAKKITISELLDDPSKVKVVFSADHEALYFSRSCIPHLRDNTEVDDRLQKADYYKHIGIYGYQRETLLELQHLSPTPLEHTESLEQLRWLEHGFKIKVGLTTFESQMIDTPDDLLKIQLK